MSSDLWGAQSLQCPVTFMNGFSRQIGSEGVLTKRLPPPVGLNRRAVLAALAGSAVAAASAKGEVRAPSPPPLIAEDYADARKTFKTRLTRLGPSPDAPDALAPPGGAELITYAAEGLKLRAWIPPAVKGTQRPGMR